MNANDAWNVAINQLEIQLDRASFNTWLRDTVFLSCDNGTFMIGVPSTYVRDMLQHRMYRNIRRVLGDVCGYPVEVCFQVHQTQRGRNSDGDLPLFRLLAEQQAEENHTAVTPLHQQMQRPQRPDLPENELNPRMTFERFVANSANRMAYEAALAVAENPAQNYNPFVLYGGVGLGKTHLLQSIANVCQNRGLRVIYIPSEVFTNDLVDAIRQRGTAMFRERYRSVDVLLVDDIQFISGKESTQEEFFHTFNALYTYNKQIILASDRHPSRLTTLEDRLRSRFSGGLVMDLQPPEFETRVAIVEMWAQERGVELPRSVCEAIADRARSNVREMEGIFNQVVATSQMARRGLPGNTTSEVLDNYRRPRQHVTLDRVLEITARYHGISVEDLVGPRRTQKISQARQIAMYLSRESTLASLPQIGEVFGGRAHTTVLHSCNKVAEEMQSDEILRRGVQAIQEELLGSSV